MTGGCAGSGGKLKGGKASEGREGARLGAEATPAKEPALTGAAAGTACPRFEFEVEFEFELKACMLGKL